VPATAPDHQSQRYGPQAGGGVVQRAGIGFASQIVGTTSIPTQVLLSNAGDVGLNISNISVSASFGQTNSCPATLAGGTNCAIYVTFTPRSAAK